MADSKACTVCGFEKPATAEHFARHRHSRTGLRAMCRECHRAKQREYREANRDADIARASAWQKENRERRNEYMRARADENRAKINAQHKRRRDENRDAALAREAAWRASNPEARRAISRRYNQRARQDPGVRLNDRMRTRMSLALKAIRSEKRNRRWSDLVGYTLDDLREHIERQFANGMTWANMGKWHIDHIVPLSSFNFASADDPEFRAAWALTNLQPLWASENWSKNARRTVLL